MKRLARLWFHTLHSALVAQPISLHGIDTLDLLHIDAGGYDWQVLQTLNLSTTAPTLIQLETGPMARQDLSAMAGLLQACGVLLFYGGMQRNAQAMRKDFFLD